MNNYPEWWNHTVTVYNKYEDSQTRAVTWYKTVLHNCFWQESEDKLSVGETIIKTNSTKCRVPVNTKFKERFEWEQLSVADKTNYFTLGTGDIIVLGEVDDIVDEYSSGHRSSDLLNKHKKMRGCMVINKCSINTGPGRGCEHYYVKGV